jgi:hypothetical protein
MYGSLRVSLCFLALGRRRGEEQKPAFESNLILSRAKVFPETPQNREVLVGGDVLGSERVLCPIERELRADSI